VHAGDSRGLAWEVNVAGSTLVHDLLSDVMLPSPTGSRGWVVHATGVEQQVAVLLPDGAGRFEVVVSRPGSSVDDVFGPATCRTARFHLEHRSSRDTDPGG